VCSTLFLDRDVLFMEETVFFLSFQASHSPAICSRRHSCEGDFALSSFFRHVLAEIGGAGKCDALSRVRAYTCKGWSSYRRYDCPFWQSFFRLSSFFFFFTSTADEKNGACDDDDDDDGGGRGSPLLCLLRLSLFRFHLITFCALAADGERPWGGQEEACLGRGGGGGSNRHGREVGREEGAGGRQGEEKRREKSAGKRGEFADETSWRCNYPREGDSICQNKDCWSALRRLSTRTKK